jgi:hypothetical protein
MSDETVSPPGRQTIFSRSTSCGDEGDELAILPIAVFDLVSSLDLFSLVRVPSDHLVASVVLHTRVLQGGNELCRIECFDHGKAVSELKTTIEAEAGLVPALTRLINPESLVELQEHLTLEDMGMPSEHDLAEGTIQLYAQKVKKVVVADELQIAPGEVTDSKLAVLCDSNRDDPIDIMVLCGCCRVTNISCLVQLTTISHLDISGCNLGAQAHHRGCFHLAGVIKDMGALTRLDISKNKLFHDDGTLAGQVISDMLAANSTLKEIDISTSAQYDIISKGGPSFAQALSVQRWDISSVNLLKNGIGIDQAQALTNMLKGHPTLKSLCGNTGDETELDMSGKMSGAEDAIILATEIADNRALLTLIFGGDKINSWVGTAPEPATLKVGLTEADFSSKNLGPAGAIIISAWISHKDKGAMTKFDISSNKIRAEGAKALAAGLKGNQVITELNISSNNLGYNSDGKYETSGVIAIADAIPDMRAMSKLTFGDKQPVITMTTEMAEANFSGKLKSYEVHIIAAFLPKCT